MHKHTYTYVCMYVYENTCMYICMYVHKHTYIYKQVVYLKYMQDKIVNYTPVKLQKKI